MAAPGTILKLNHLLIMLLLCSKVYWLCTFSLFLYFLSASPLWTVS